MSSKKRVKQLTRLVLSALLLGGPMWTPVAEGTEVTISTQTPSTISSDNNFTYRPAQGGISAIKK